MNWAARRNRVLIVEDDIDLRDMMAQIFTFEGFDVVTASNGYEALICLRGAAAPDVILLDLMMPVMDGWEFRRTQRRDPRLANVPVIATSAVPKTRAADLDLTAFLNKPVDFDKLIALVREHAPRH